MSNLIPWHHTAAAQRILAQADPDQIFVGECELAIPSDRFILFGDILSDLTAVRNEFLSVKLGGSFREVEAQGRAQEWLAADYDHMSVQAVLAERFGSPMRFAGYTRDQAEHMWRISAKAGIERSVAA